MAKSRTIGVGALLLVFLWTAMASVAWAQDTENKPKNIRRVILVVLSGVSQEGIRMSHTPTLNGLGNEGVQADGAISVYPVDTPTVLASLTTGALPVVHGYQGGASVPKAESLWQVFNGAGLKNLVVSNSEEDLQGLYQPFAWQHVIKGSDREVMDKAIHALKEHKPYGALIILNGPHKAGHQYGAESVNYRKAINEADTQLGRLLHALREAGELDETLLVVTGDHGMAGTGHGGGTDPIREKEYVVPLLMRGPKLAVGNVAIAQLVDVAPTVAQLTNMRRPAQAGGDVLWNALGADLFGLGKLELLERRIKDLSLKVQEETRQNFKMIDDKTNIDRRVKQVEEQKRDMTRQVAERDQAIESLKENIGWWQMALGASVLLALAGFVVEYVVLRKRFLMFG